MKISNLWKVPVTAIAFSAALFISGGAINSGMGSSLTNQAHAAGPASVADLADELIPPALALHASSAAPPAS